MISESSIATTEKVKESVLEAAEGKNVSRQLLDLEILYLLTFGAKSGYELKKSLLSSFNLNLSYGTLYPHLHSLEKGEVIRGNWEFQADNAPLKKRVYTLTTSGSEKLARSIGTLSKIALTMQYMLMRVDLKSHASPQIEKSETALREAEEFLTSQGYSVKRNAALHGASGTEHVIDIYATRLEDSSRTDSLIIKIAGNDGGIGMEDLFKLCIVSYDLRASRVVLLAIPSAQEEASKLAEFFHISIYEGKTFEQSVANMCSHFDKK
ncbi:MAG: PadR family transcriptional regulator [Nitrososphaerales archaeon]